MQPAPPAVAEAARTARPRFLVVLYSAMSPLDLAWLCPVDHVLAASASPTSSRGSVSPSRAVPHLVQRRVLCNEQLPLVRERHDVTISE
eukprot:1990774-Prymnesium_polylepis.1